jgi:hypothetical protein
MSSATLSGTSLTVVQQQFESSFPSMDKVIRHQFRNWPAASRAEALADARAALWAAWCSLTRRGKDPLEVGVTGIAPSAGSESRSSAWTNPPVRSRPLGPAAGENG